MNQIRVTLTDGQTITMPAARTNGLAVTHVAA